MITAKALVLPSCPWCEHHMGRHTPEFTWEDGGVDYARRCLTCLDCIYFMRYQP